MCRNSQGVEVRATPLRMTRFAATFEVYNPFSIVQLSEVLSEFKIVMSDRVVYSGRAVVSSIVNAGIMVVCEAALEEGWLDVELLSPQDRKARLREQFEEFVTEWRKVDVVTPEFKVVVAGRLFEERLTTKSAGKGTGLGLAIVGRMVREAGGAIVMKTEPGAGTVFTLYFPSVD